MSKVDFDHGKTFTNIIQTALPMLVAQLLNLLYNIVDRIYIGRIEGIGTAALGAVGLCFPIIIIINGFTNMFGMGGSPLFSMEMGRGDHKKAAEILNTAIRQFVVTGTIIMVVGEVFSVPLLTLFGATAGEIPLALPYLRVYLIGTLFLMLATGGNPYINAEGYSTFGMMTVMIGAAANLILDPLFIFGLHMGIVGAAVATVLSQFLSFCFVVWFFKSNKNDYRIVMPQRGQKWFPHGGEIASLGVAPFIMQCTNSLVQIACNHVLMAFGGATYISIMTIVSSVRSIVDTPVLAVTNGSSPVISYNYGARRPKKVRKAIGMMILLAFPYTIVMWLVIRLWPDMLIRIFTTDQALRTATVPALHLYFYAFIFQSFQYAGQNVFKSLGKKKEAIFFSLFRKVIMVVPLTYALPYLFHMGTDGVFIAEPISNFVGGLACFITMLATVLPELKRMEE